MMVTLVAVLVACSRSRHTVEGSFAISLVQTQNVGLPSNAPPTQGGSPDSNRLLIAHPSFVSSNSPVQYWVERRELVTAADLLSAEVRLREPFRLTKAQFEEGIQKYGRDVPGLTNMSYEEFRKNNESPQPEIFLTFTEAGRIRFAEVTRRHTGRQLAIIVADQVVTAPLIREAITGGVAVVSGTYTPAEARAIVDSIRGKH